MTTPVGGLDAFTQLLGPEEFAWVTDFLYEHTGIVLKEGKQPMVTGRLAKRLRHFGMTSYAEYLARLADPGDPEIRVAIDLLTTNETYFFREPAHFTFLREVMAGRSATAQRETPSRPVRVWSAASSSGEEAYSIAMTLDDCLWGTGWEVVGTDISSVRAR